MEERREVSEVLGGRLRLASMRHAELARRRAEAQLLQLVEEHARLTPSPQPLMIRGQEVAVPFGGEGTTMAGQFVITDVALALGKTESEAHQLIADAVELVQRLPLVWARVVAGSLDPQRARRIARATISVTADVAAEVDRRVAPHADALGVRQLKKLVAAVVLEAEQYVENPRDRHVDVHTPLGSPDGFIEAVTDAHSAALFDAELSRIACCLGKSGDESTLDERRAKAIGIMACPELHLAVVNGEDGKSSARPQLVLHVTMTDAALATPRVVDAGRLGPQLLDTIRAWAGHSRVTVRPVVDAEALRPVDSYHVPVAMREAMEHRHRSCVFPWCDRPPHRGEADSDHIEPFEPGRPGQTNLRNLAPLCRRHHRLKTHAGWRYRALGPTTFVWTSPRGEEFVRGPEGTHPINDRVPDLHRELARLDRVLGDGWTTKPLPQVDVRVLLPPHRRVPLRRLMRATRSRALPGARDDPAPF